MKKIVSIERQRRNKKRYTLYFDDGEWLGLFDELIVIHGLKVGDQVDGGQLTRLAREDDAKKAMNLGLRYLGYRSRSQKEMTTYLEGKGFCQEIIDKTLEKLKDYGYINDSAFAKSWIEGRMAAKHMGRAMIKRELILKGIDDDIIEEHLSQITPDEEENQAYNLVLKYHRRYKDLDSREQFQKLGAALARKGFNWETIKGAIRKLNLEEWDE